MAQARLFQPRFNHRNWCGFLVSCPKEDFHELALIGPSWEIWGCSVLWFVDQPRPNHAPPSTPIARLHRASLTIAISCPTNPCLCRTSPKGACTTVGARVDLGTLQPWNSGTFSFHIGAPPLVPCSWPPREQHETFTVDCASQCHRFVSTLSFELLPPSVLAQRTIPCSDRTEMASNAEEGGIASCACLAHPPTR